ncbi:hypothetical protein C5167_033222 [Papaver somniferum]|uniref:Uncharacterized protein n=1 Tax=Papaver somniferum TaxID=3469 RepID=A0A4Y7KBE7_PAPSO|nr:hypothetical protein C5167_033222 [Papaver somniferum]
MFEKKIGNTSIESEMNIDTGAFSWLCEQFQQMLDTKFSEYEASMQAETKKLTL